MMSCRSGHNLKYIFWALLSLKQAKLRSESTHFDRVGGVDRHGLNLQTEFRF